MRASSIKSFLMLTHNKQQLVEAEHFKNNQSRSRRSLPIPKVEADNTVARFILLDIMRKLNSIIVLTIPFLNNLHKKTLLSEFAKI